MCAEQCSVVKWIKPWKWTFRQSISQRRIQNWMEIAELGFAAVCFDFDFFAFIASVAM